MDMQTKLLKGYSLAVTCEAVGASAINQLNGFIQFAILVHVDSKERPEDVILKVK